MTGSGRHLPAEATTVTRQVDLYGLTRADRLHGMMRPACGPGQPRRRERPVRADVTQLINGVKVSNPAVYTRVVRLEEMAGSPGVAAGDPVEIARVLADVSTATPRLTTVAVPVQPPSPGERAPAVRHLAAVPPPTVLRMAAAEVPGTDLAALLSEAAAADWAGRPRP